MIPSGPAHFATTHWSLVLAAGHKSSPASERALEELCQAYWYRLYAYARRRVGTVHAAQDLTQEFFARVLEKEYLQAADRDKGRFRSFLLTMFKRFLSNERERERAQKRGGGRRACSLDLDSAEALYCRQPADDETPEAVFERRWALTLLERVLRALADEYAAKGKQELFEQCQPLLTGDSGAPSHAEIGARLDMSEGAVKVAIHRLRQRYRELLQAEVAATVADATAVDDELRILLAALRGEKKST
jgi:RNA polymerase sigma-70 factor (ECF subfamily)